LDKGNLEFSYEVIKVVSEYARLEIGKALKFKKTQATELTLH